MQPNTRHETHNKNEEDNGEKTHTITNQVKWQQWAVHCMWSWVGGVLWHRWASPAHFIMIKLMRLFSLNSFCKFQFCIRSQNHKHNAPNGVEWNWQLTPSCINVAAFFRRCTDVFTPSISVIFFVVLTIKFVYRASMTYFECWMLIEALHRMEE